MSKITSTVAKESDGNVQIVFTIPYETIKHAQEETLIEMGKDITVPGFRKGKAPIGKVKEKISQNTLIEHSLSHVLPKALSDAISEHKVKIAIYPKFELVSADEGKDWQIKAITCELPEIKLPSNLKEKVAGEIRSISIKDKPTREQKETVVIKYLTENIKFEIPKVLIDEEVNSRLTSWLARIEKLGLALESYLASIGKNTETIRAEYQAQAKEAIALDLILSKIVEEEKISVTEKEIADSMAAAEAKPENKQMIESILKKRMALELLTNLA